MEDSLSLSRAMISPMIRVLGAPVGYFGVITLAQLSTLLQIVLTCVTICVTLMVGISTKRKNDAERLRLESTKPGHE
ncbi:MAG TPA: hypothetical protein VEH27_11925 [Methylomirabilota bacterium]|nr:hypothetical protein [Methylomirabilota bacterium]